MSKKTKYFYATIATAVVASSVTTVAPTETKANTIFPDVKSTSYYFDAVKSLSERNIISGYPNGNFGPNDYVTRGQAAKIIAGVLGLDTKNVKNPKFTDVSTNHPYYGVIAALQNEGIINGTGNGKFQPNDPIKRNHMAKIISIAFDIKASKNNLLPFKDVNRNYENYIAGLYEYGITSGTTATTFAGDASVTRGELAVFIHRAEDIGQEITIENVTSNGIQTEFGNYPIASSLYSIFNSTNADALKGAVVKATIKDGKITKISSLTLNSAGTASQSIVLDGAGSTLDGNLFVNADNIQLKNLKVQGQIKLSDKVANSFIAENVESTGELVIEEGKTSPVASLNLMVANTSTGPKIELKQSKVSGIDTKRNNVQLNSDTKIPYVNVSALVSSIEINSDVDKVTVDVSVNIEIKGSANIAELSVDQASEIALNIAGDIKKLLVENKNSKVEIGVNLSINQLIVPNDSDAASIVKNFDAIKHKIEEILNDSGQVVSQPGNNTGGSSDVGNPGNSNKNFNLSIMHTNDTHASLDNAAKTVTAVKEVRAEKPDALLLNAGDVFSGSLYFNEFQGQADLKMMNLMGYDAMTFGNHEFDLGSSEEGHQALVDFIEGASFPFVSANVNFAADEKFTGLFSDLVSSEPENGKIYNGIIKEINGEKVGIFGLTTQETEDLSSPGKITFENYKEEAEKAVKAFEGMGVDKIIAITHIGYNDNAAVDNDLTLAKEVEGIDVIVGGHSHTTLKAPVLVDNDETPTVIVQAGSSNANLGLLDIEFDKNGVVVSQAGELIAIGSQVEDAEAKILLEPYKEQVDALAQQEIGVSTEVTLENPRGDEGESVRKNETILGNLITDGMLSKAKKATDKNVIMALQNGGGIRSSIDAGPITIGEVITVLPFGNTLAVMDVTGAELKEAFEISFGKYPKENGGFLHVAGAKVEYDSTKTAGERVVSIQYQDSEGTYVDIQDSETYTIATNAFTAQGGDGYDVFKEAYDEGRVTDLGLSDWENFAEHLKSLDSIPTEIEGRIVDVADKVLDPGTKPELYNSNPENFIVSQIARYDSGQGPTGTEIMAYDAALKLAFVTNGALSGYDILSFADIKSGEFTQVDSEKRVLLADYGISGVSDITSIASHPTKDLIAISAVSENKTDNGYIVFATKDGKYVNHVEVGALPDMVTFTPDGTKAIVANEGEPADDYSVDPEGSISIIDVETFEETTLTFTETLLDDKVRVNSQGTILQQLEPEYVTVSADSKTAYVSLQENNAIATINLETMKIESVKGLGVKDYSIAGNEVDALNDKTIKLEKQPVLSFFMPDAIDTIEVGGKTYIITPNEGDVRDWDAYSEEISVEDIISEIQLNADHYEGYTQDELDAFVAGGGLQALADGKLKLTKENGMNAETGKYEALYGFGGRSFSIFDAATMELVFDSGNDFEAFMAEKTPEYFNTTNDEIKVDNRSDDKGPEPETAIIGEIDGTKYSFIALERFGGIAVYDLSEINSPKFVTVISSRNFNVDGSLEDDIAAEDVADVGGDVSPEGLVFISAEESPTGKALLVATHEISGTVAVYELGKGTGVLAASEFSGTSEESKVHFGNVKVSVDNLERLGNAVIKGNLTLIGSLKDSFSISNVKVEGDLDLTNLVDGSELDISDVEVSGETTF